MLPGGWRTFAGQADDPFFLDLRVFDLLYGGDLSETGRDTLAGYNVNSDRPRGAVQRRCPQEERRATPSSGSGPPPSATAYACRQPRQCTGNDGVQVSRLGNPLVNEVVVPAGLKDAFNASRPDQDATNPQLVARVTDPEVPQADQRDLQACPRPLRPRNDLVEIFLTGITTKAGGPIQATSTRSSTTPT
jgi:hypothetical protein